MTLVDLPGGAQADLDASVLVVDDVFIHVNRAANRTIEYRRKAAIGASRDALAQEMQAAENALQAVRTSRLIDAAQGAQLDMLGKLVGELRAGREDPDFRIRVRARILINQSMGRPPEILQLLQTLGVLDATLTEYPPAAFRLELAAPPPTLATGGELPGLVSETRAAGIGARVVMPTSDNGFTFLDLVAGVSDGTLGFGDIVAPDPAIGGTLADVRAA
jgi:hypothetical protein